MAITHVVSVNWTRSGEQIAKNVTIGAADDGEVNADVSLTALQANKQVSFALTLAALKSLYISSDVNTTIETNSSSAADDTLTVTAGKPLVWYEDCGLPNPFASGNNVTTLYLTNGANTTGTVQIRCLRDATP